MGMELVSHWLCDRCGQSATGASLEEAPAGWAFLITPAAVNIDPETLLIDMKMSFEKFLCCNDCTVFINEWLHQYKHVAEQLPLEELPTASEVQSRPDAATEQTGISDTLVSSLESDII